MTQLKYRGGSKKNLFDQQGRPDLPLGPIGCCWLMGNNHPGAISNRYVLRIDPYAPPGDKASQAAIGGIYSCAQEFWRQRVDPATVWLEGGRADALPKWLAIHDFERWCGNTGDAYRYFSADEMLLTQRTKPHLVEGMLQCAETYALTGRQIVFHSGCPDSASWAGNLIKTGAARDRGELLRVLHETYAPLVERGIAIGMDNGAAQPKESITYAEALRLRLAGAFVQIEATPEKKSTHWRYWPCRAAYSWFVQCHGCGATQPAPWAAGRFPPLGSDEFRKLYPDCRVILYHSDVPAPARLNGPDADKRAYLADAAALSKELIAGGVRVLLWERIVLEAARLNVPVTEFVPA